MSTITTHQLSIATNNAICLDGAWIGYHVRQTASGTEVYKPHSMITLKLPKERYSLAFERPKCGAGRSEFYADLKAALWATIELDKAAPLMDDELREEIHDDVRANDPAWFLAEYKRQHLERFGEPFIIN